jgi:hypothetical protein
MYNLLAEEEECIKWGGVNVCLGIGDGLLSTERDAQGRGLSKNSETSERIVMMMENGNKITQKMLTCFSRARVHVCTAFYRSTTGRALRLLKKEVSTSAQRHDEFPFLTILVVAYPTLGVTRSTTLREVTETFVVSPEHAVSQQRPPKPTGVRTDFKEFAFSDKVVSDLPPYRGQSLPVHDQRSSYHLHQSHNTTPTPTPPPPSQAPNLDPQLPTPNSNPHCSKRSHPFRFFKRTKASSTV